MSILQSENCTQTCLGPGKYLFSYSAEYIVCRPTRVIILFLPHKVQEFSELTWPRSHVQFGAETGNKSANPECQHSVIKSLLFLLMLTSRIYIKSSIYGMPPSFEHFVLLSLLVNIKISGGSIHLFHASIDSLAFILVFIFCFPNFKTKQNKPTLPLSMKEDTSLV